MMDTYPNINQPCAQRTRPDTGSSTQRGSKLAKVVEALIIMGASATLTFVALVAASTLWAKDAPETCPPLLIEVPQ